MEGDPNGKRSLVDNVDEESADEGNSQAIVGDSSSSPGCSDNDSFCKISHHLSMPSPTSLDIGLTAGITALGLRRKESSRRHVRMAFSRGEQRIKRPDEETLAQVESPDLNKAIRHLLVSNNASAIANRSFETLLPFLAKDESRTVAALRCTENSGQATEIKMETRNKLESLALKYNMITSVEVSVREIAACDDVGPLVVKEAEAQSPDLIVVGTKHTGIFCGHTCDIVVHQSSFPVLVVRSFGSPYCPRARMMVAIDGSIVSLSALRYAMRLAPNTMTLVPVVVVPGGQKIVSLVRQAAESVEGPTCVVEDAVVASMKFNMGQNLCALADELNVDILIIGTTEGDTELGTVESFLIYQANCHVLVYKNQWLMDKNHHIRSNSSSRKNSKVSRRESLKIPLETMHPFFSQHN